MFQLPWTWGWITLNFHVSDSDVKQLHLCSSAKETVAHTLYYACKKYKTMRNQTLYIELLNKLYLGNWFRNICFSQKWVEPLFPLLVKCRFRLKGWSKIFNEFKMQFKQFPCPLLFFIALSVGLNDLLIYFFFYEKHLFNLITCTLKIESENGKMICARDCCRKCHLNSRWLGGEQRNSSRKPEKRLEKKLKGSVESEGKSVWELGFICRQKHLLTEMAAMEVKCVYTWKSI